MKKKKVLFASLLTATTIPLFIATACSENKILPKSISISTVEQGGATEITIDENGSLTFLAKVLPEECSQQVDFVSSNPSVGIIRNSKLIPQGIGKCEITAHPRGYPGVVSSKITVTIAAEEDFTKIDETDVTSDGHLISGLDKSYGFILSNFKADFLITEEQWQIGTHGLTAEIVWSSSEDLEDYAAGITNIKYDSFGNSIFDVACSFKSKKDIEIGHLFKFSLIFYVKNFQTGETIEVIGKREYSIECKTQQSYVVIDTDVEKQIDFNTGDYKYALVKGFRTDYLFGDGTPFNLVAEAPSIEETPSIAVESIEILNKVEKEGTTTFDLGIHTYGPVVLFNPMSLNYISFALNGIRVTLSRDYVVNKTDTISFPDPDPSHRFSIDNTSGKSKLVISNLESNFDFSEDKLSPTFTMLNKEYAKPTAYNIVKKNNTKFDLEVYWDTLLPYFSQESFTLNFTLDGRQIALPSNVYHVWNLEKEIEIKFNGEDTFKLSYDESQSLYFVRLSSFNVISATLPDDFYQKLSFKLKDGTTEIASIFDIEKQSFSSDAFDLIVSWNEKPPLLKQLSLEASYNELKLISDLNLSIYEPEEEDFYNIRPETNAGSVTVLNNKQGEVIQLGISDINLTKYALTGMKLKFNDGGEIDMLTSLLYSFDYNSDTTSPYKILIDIQTTFSYPEYGIEYSITSSDILDFKIVFEEIGSSNIIQLGTDAQGSLIDVGVRVFKTNQPVTIKPNETYYFKMKISDWPFAEEYKQKMGGQPFDGLIMFCGNDLYDMSDWHPLSGEFTTYYNQYGCLVTNWAESSVPFAEISFGFRDLLNWSWDAEIAVVWKPEITSSFTADFCVAHPSFS